MLASSEFPPVSVIMTTRNRASDAARAVASILAVDYPTFELCVVDQSAGDETERALAPYRDDSRLRHFRSAAYGASRGRNVAVSHARYDCFASVDDDCEVSADWLRQLARALAVDGKIGVVYGSVIAAPHDSQAGFLPAYEPAASTLIRTIGEKGSMRGMSACMGMRRACWEALEGFDELLGAGAAFRAGEDGDLGFRALARGFFVYDEPAFKVIHHGFREWPVARRLLGDGWFGIGAALAKFVKARQWPVFPIVWRECGIGELPINVLHRRKPVGLRRTLDFMKGFWAGLVVPVDPATLKFRR